MIYRSNEEISYWRNRDPVVNFKRYLESRKDISAQEIQLIEDEVSNEVSEAFDFAEHSKFPNVEEALSNVYSDIVITGR